MNEIVLSVFLLFTQTVHCVKDTCITTTVEVHQMKNVNGCMKIASAANASGKLPKDVKASCHVVETEGKPSSTNKEVQV